MKIILIILCFIVCNANQCKKQTKIIIQKNQKNIMTMTNAPIISSRIKNYFYIGNDNSIPLRNNPYYISSTGLMYAPLGQSITINLLQNYEINNVKFRLNDSDDRTYNIIVYAIYKQRTTKIFDSINAQSLISINFPTQLVSQLKIYNRGGNNYSNPNVHISKIIANYRYQPNLND